jgi:hypothetical protein
MVRRTLRALDAHCVVVFVRERRRRRRSSEGGRLGDGQTAAGETSLVRPRLDIQVEEYVRRERARKGRGRRVRKRTRRPGPETREDDATLTPLLPIDLRPQPPSFHHEHTPKTDDLKDSCTPRYLPATLRSVCSRMRPHHTATLVALL